MVIINYTLPTVTCVSPHKYLTTFPFQTVWSLIYNVMKPTYILSWELSECQSVVAPSNELHYQGLPEVLAKTLVLNKIHFRRIVGQSWCCASFIIELRISVHFLNLNWGRKKDPCRFVISVEMQLTLSPPAFVFLKVASLYLILDQHFIR